MRGHLLLIDIVKDLDPAIESFEVVGFPGKFGEIESSSFGFAIVADDAMLGKKRLGANRVIGTASGQRQQEHDRSRDNSLACKAFTAAVIGHGVNARKGDYQWSKKHNESAN